MNRTKFVGESHFFQIFSFFFRSGNRDMNLMLFKETAGIVQPLRRVVVSRDEKHRNPGRDVGKLREELIQHRIGLPGGNRAVKNIPRNQNRIRMILFCPLRDLMQNRPLIGKQTVGIELFTDMKIRNMKQVGERGKEIKMKRLFRRNQIIITTLAVMIAAAGYLNYAGKRDLEAGGQVADMGSLELSDEDLMAENLAAQSETVQDILSLDNDPNDTEVAEAQTEGTDLAQAGSENGEQSGMADTEEQTTGNDAPAGYENPGEAVLTSGMSVADYIAGVQLSREQIRAKNKETLMSLINSTSIDEAAKQQAIQDMIRLTEISEKENAAETLLMAKGFSDPVVSITDDKVDVVIHASSITDPERAQIEDIVKRKAEVGADQIIITLLNMAD